MTISQEDLVQQVAVNLNSIKSLQHQINDMKDLVDSIKELATEVKYLRTDVTRMQTDLDEIKNKPSKRYDLIITTAISAIISGVAGYFLGFFIN